MNKYYDENGREFRVYSMEKERAKTTDASDPKSIFMSLAKRYEHDGQSKIEALRRIAREEPDLWERYDRQVKGGNTRMRDASIEATDRAHNYMRKHDVDYKTALFAVFREDPALYQRWNLG